MTSKPTPSFFISLIIVLSMSAVASCAAPAPTPAPTATSTATNIPTETLTPTATSSSTPSPLPSSTATYTAVPTETVSEDSNSVQSRDQFEELVQEGKVKCLGSKTGGQSTVMHFMEKAVAAGLIAKGQLTLGAGIPSTENPTQCLFLITFKDGNSVIIYRDSETGKYVQLPIVE
jgi:hypothetical protein